MWISRDESLAHRHRGGPTQYFLNQSVQVGGTVTIHNRGEPVSDHTVQFFLRFPLDLRVQCHCENGVQDGGVCLSMAADKAFVVC